MHTPLIRSTTHDVQIYSTGSSAPGTGKPPQGTGWRVDALLSSLLLRDYGAGVVCTVRTVFLEFSNAGGLRRCELCSFWLEAMNFITCEQGTLKQQHGKLVDEHPNFLTKRGGYNSEEFLVCIPSIPG